MECVQHRRQEQPQSNVSLQGSEHSFIKCSRPITWVSDHNEGLLAVSGLRPSWTNASRLSLTSQAALQQQCCVTALPGGWDDERLGLSDLSAGWEFLNKHIWRGKFSFLDLSLLVRLLQKHREPSHQEQTLPSVSLPHGLAGGTPAWLWLGHIQPASSRHATHCQKGEAKTGYLGLPVPSSASQGSWR